MNSLVCFAQNRIMAPPITFADMNISWTRISPLYPYSFSSTWSVRLEYLIFLIKLEPVLKLFEYHIIFFTHNISYTLFSSHIYNVPYYICTTFCQRFIYIGRRVNFFLFLFFFPLNYSTYRDVFYFLPLYIMLKIYLVVLYWSKLDFWFLKTFR